MVTGSLGVCDSTKVLHILVEEISQLFFLMFLASTYTRREDERGTIVPATPIYQKMFQMP